MPFYGMESAPAAWTALARANAELEPPEWRGPLLPYDPATAQSFGVPGPGVPEEFV